MALEVVGVHAESLNLVGTFLDRLGGTTSTLRDSSLSGVAGTFLDHFAGTTFTLGDPSFSDVDWSDLLSDSLQSLKLKSWNS